MAGAPVGCATLVAFAVVDVRFDPTVAAHGPFVALAVAAVGVALVHLGVRRAGGRCDTSPVLPWATVTLVLLAAATGLTLLGLHLEASEAVHRERADRVLGTVTRHVTTDDDTDITVRTDDGRTFRFPVVDFSPYPIGAVTAVDVDPEDHTWQELVAEGHDPTWTFLLAAAAGVLAIGAAGRAVEVAVARRGQVPAAARHLHLGRFTLILAAAARCRRPAVTGEAARRLDRTLRTGLGLGLAAGFGGAVLGDTTPCSVADPAVCGADATGSAVVGLLFAVPLLLWLLPTLACAALVVFAGLDVAYDDDPAAHGPFIALAVAAVVVGLLHRRLLAAGRRAEAEVPLAPGTLPERLSDRTATHILDHDEGFLVTLAAAGLLLASVLATAAGIAAIRADAAHRARSVQVPVVVTRQVTKDDGDSTAVDLRAADGRTWELGVLDFRPYPVGETTLVAVDPAHPDWVELVAEPHDPTLWLTLATGALVLGLGCGVRAFEAGSRPRRSATLVIRTPRVARLRAGALAAGSIVVGPAGVWVADTWPERLTAGPGAANAAWIGTARWTRGLDADRARLRLHAGWWSHDLPWSAVGAVQPVGAPVLVSDARGDAHVFGPFPGGAAGSALDRTAEVDRRLSGWRQAEPAGRHARRPPRRSLAPAGIVTAGLIAVECAAAALAAV